MTSNFDKIPAFDESTGELNVVVETPQGSRNKYNYDEKTGVFKLAGVMPVGYSFPYDFGFVPQTIGGDGDPLDVLVLTDEPTFPACLVAARLIGVIEAEQTECDGTTERNDRLIAVATTSKIYKNVKSLNDLDETLTDQIEKFFVFYNETKGKKFAPLGRSGKIRARKVVEEGIRLKRLK